MSERFFALVDRLNGVAASDRGPSIGIVLAYNIQHEPRKP